MLKNSLLKIAFLVPLVAVTATARAGSTISDKSYWPSEARRTTDVAMGFASQRDLNSAFASERATSAHEPTTSAIAGGSGWRYQGGPKGR